LKHRYGRDALFVFGSPPARGRGLKPLAFFPVQTVISVAPCAGAWIETGMH